MKFSKKDIPHIRGLLITTVLVSMLGGITVYVSNGMLHEAQQSKITADQEWSDAVRKLERTKNEQEDLQGYYHQYQHLVKQNIIGKEKRLDWIESIEKIRTRLKIFSVKYRLDPQKKLDIKGNDLSGSSFDLYRSTMTLDLSLLHEGQLLNFIDILSEEVKGMYMLDSCILTRNDLVRRLKFTPNIEAECTLGWITLNEKKLDNV